MNKVELIALIEQAFADTVYPSGAKVTDCTWNCDECAEIAREFEGRSWVSLTDVKFLRYHEAALALMTAEARRYYLPAFMLAVLTDRKRADVIVHSLENGFTPPETEGMEAEEWFAKFGTTKMGYFLNRNSGFTPEQKRAIKAYLQYYFELAPWEERQQERQDALHFWSTFEG